MFRLVYRGYYMNILQFEGLVDKNSFCKLFILRNLSFKILLQTSISNVIDKPTCVDLNVIARLEGH